MRKRSRPSRLGTPRKETIMTTLATAVHIAFDMPQKAIADVNWQNRSVSEHRGRVETEYRQALSELMECTRKSMLGDVERILREWNDWLRLIKACRAAEERGGGRLPHDPHGKDADNHHRRGPAGSRKRGGSPRTVSPGERLNRRGIPGRLPSARERGPDGPVVINREQAAEREARRSEGLVVTVERG